MSSRCEKCGKLNQSVQDRFCPKHAQQTLRRLERSGYLEPLTIGTASGLEKLSPDRFLTLNDWNPTK